MPRRFLAAVCGLLARISLAVRDPRARSHMPELTLGLLCADRPKTVTRVLEWLGRRDQDWSPFYRLLSQAKWSEHDLFRPILHSCCQLAGPPGAPLSCRVGPPQVSSLQWNAVQNQRLGALTDTRLGTESRVR